RAAGLPRVERLGPEELELHGVGPRLGGDVDQSPRLVQAPVVIGAGLGDHVARLSVADPPPADVEHRHTHGLRNTGSTTRPWSRRAASPAFTAAATPASAAPSAASVRV